MDTTSLITGISLIIISVGLLLHAEQLYKVLGALFSLGITILCSPLIIPFVFIYTLISWLDEMDGKCTDGGGYIFEKMNWSEFVDYKFKGKARQSKC